MKKNLEFFASAEDILLIVYKSVEKGDRNTLCSV